MRIATLLLVALLTVPSAVAQAQPVEDGEKVEILRVANPATLHLDRPFDLQVTLQNHLSRAVTVALFATLHAPGQGDPCNGQRSHGEVTHTIGDDGTVKNIHPTVRLRAGQTLTYPPSGTDWTGVVDESNDPGDGGPFRLCYWIEAPDKTEEDAEGNTVPKYPWFYDRHDVFVEVRTTSADGVAITDLEGPGSLAPGISYPIQVTLQNPLPRSVEVRLTARLHVEGCSGEALTRVMGPVEVLLSADSEEQVVTTQGVPTLAVNVSDAEAPPSGQYTLCVTAVPEEGDTTLHGIGVYVRSDNQPPSGILHIAPRQWNPGTEVRFAVDVHDGDGDPVDVTWDFAGAAVASGDNATYTFPFIDTFVVLVILDDGFEEVRYTCLVPAPGQISGEGGIHGCPVFEPPHRGVPALHLALTSGAVLVAAFVSRRRH